MLTHYTRKRLEEERKRQENPVVEKHDVEFSEEVTPQFEVNDNSEKRTKRKKKGEE